MPTLVESFFYQDPPRKQDALSRTKSRAIDIVKFLDSPTSSRISYNEAGSLSTADQLLKAINQPLLNNLVKVDRKGSCP